MGTMFIRVIFFFMIANVFLGVVIGLLGSDPENNPNTTIFSDQGINQSSVITPVNLTEFHAGQFTPENETGIPIVDDAAEFFDLVDFLNIGELLEFVKVFNAFYSITIMENMLDLIGVEFPPGIIDGFGVILTFGAILWFLFLIFKVTTI